MENKHILCWNHYKNDLEKISIDNVTDIATLYGLNEQIKKIEENTKAFELGLPFNHGLLWGVRGSGKSTLVRSILKKLILRTTDCDVIEVNSEDIDDLPNIFLNQKFNKKIIIFIDDLSFEQNDRRYIQFKSFLEGSFYTNRYKFLTYVTSNRRHLMKRDMLDNERSSAISQDEGVEEKVSLSDRFGLWVSFHNINQDEYINIVKHYFSLNKINFDEEVKIESLKWVFARGNRTGRSANQFFKNYCLKNNITLKQ
ncbi:ATP-binding protein [Alphaproteobacteria bacterium]|nr:ATP-binding protein [Alphaproteobacteria bacterium]